MRRVVTGLFLCWMTFAACAAPSVAFINPGYSSEPFWVSYSHFMQAVADDLGMELEIHYAERDFNRLLALGRQVRDRQPDYLLFVNEIYAGPELLRIFEDSPVRLFNVHSTLTASQRERTGNPRERYRNWIGSLIPNDEEAGYLMGKALAAMKPPGQAEMLAFGGVPQTPSAQLRNLGLLRALGEHPDIRLRQLVNGEWSRQRARDQARTLFERYPAVRLVWSANDEMALGAIEAVRERGLQPGRDVQFSAANNSAEVFQARLEGDIGALTSGHFTLGGWALLLVHDYHLGRDFAESIGVDALGKVFRLLDEEQVALLQRRLGAAPLQVDFRRYSRVLHPERVGYPLDLSPLLDVPTQAR
ncbi:LacI family transcription regulator [Pseudomonas flexibilis]|uniref:Monosaccharide ABC transporter substrate-binding protein, CUT2 family n=1 Tax=Pseudomonas flexibilis TaxID=706570 RepID=A0A1N6UD04_9PSED|nr:ABC transporter substrate-binding protein [Pseudomonas flexibilis]KHL68930.1 LacI family transcription regulator [Pseudomonas flexibilis]SIQ63351.1 monosaccharide ABC transporter substrate-binding protein, CUT2 family [Pseudomonas flexibilis]